MPALALPVALGALSGAGAGLVGGIGTAAGITWAAVGTGALIGAGLGALSYIISVATAAKTPRATSQTDEITLTTFTRVGRKPVVYGFRQTGGNVLQMGTTQFKDVDQGPDQPPESHLFADLVMGASEGPIAGIDAIYASEAWQNPSKWESTIGDETETPFPGFEAFITDGRAPFDRFTARVHFNGDLGNAGDIPDFAFDVRGRYPQQVIESSPSFSIKPVAAWLDGPSHSLWMIPEEPMAGRGMGILTASLPFADGDPTEIDYTEFPSLGAPIQWSWYVGMLDSVLVQDPLHSTIFYMAVRGQAGGNWEKIKLGPRYSRPILFSWLDDDCARLHTLHQHQDGTWYVCVVAILYQEKLRYKLPSFDGEQVLAFMFKPEDNRYYFVIGGEIETLSTYDLTMNEWSDVAIIDAGGLVGIIKLGIYAYVFCADRVIQVDTSIGEVVATLPLSDFMPFDEIGRLGASARCVSVSHCGSRYMGVAVFTNDAGLWSTCAFNGPRTEGEFFKKRVKFRRYAAWYAQSGRWIPLPGDDGTTPISSRTWVTTGPPDDQTSVADVIAAGNDYKTIAPTPVETHVLVASPGIITFAASHPPQGLDRSSPNFQALILVDPNSSALGHWRFWTVIPGWWFDRQQDPVEAVATEEVTAPTSFSFRTNQGIFSTTFQVQATDGAIQGPFTLTPGHQPPGSFNGPVVPNVLPSSAFDYGATLRLLGIYLAQHSTTWQPPQTFGWGTNNWGQLYVGAYSGDVVVSPRRSGLIFPPNAPLRQFTDTTLTGEAAARFIANAIGDTEVPDLFMYPSLVRVTGLDKDVLERTVAVNAQWASWDSSALVPAQEPKSPFVAVYATEGSLRVDWLQRFVTPASEAIDMITNVRYGTAAGPERVRWHRFLKLHGYSLEYVRIDDQVLRRYLYNHVVADDGPLSSFFETIYAPALAYDASTSTQYDVAFENNSIQPVMEFDASTIKADSFSIDVKSSRTLANKVRGVFWNGDDQRQDERDATDDLDRESTGGSREKQLSIECITNPARITYVTRQILESPEVDRQVANFTTGIFAGLLDVGDPIWITHPHGTFKRKPFRVVSKGDMGDEIEIEANEISPWTVDGQSFPTLRSLTKKLGSASNLGPPRASTREESIERFYGQALMPFRPGAGLRADGRLVCLAWRAPQSVFTSGVRLLPSPALGPTVDGQPVTSGRSVALQVGIDSVFQTVATIGQIDGAMLPAMPCDILILDRHSIGLLPSVEVARAIAYAAPTFPDPEGQGTITIQRATGAPILHQSGAAAKVYACTELLGPGVPALEPVGPDGEEIEASYWRNPGAWTDITGPSSSTGSPQPIVAQYRDFLVVGCDASLGFAPNCLSVELATAAVALDHSLIFEYSSLPDPSSPIGVWLPLTVMDGTAGLQRSGRIHFEIPPLWASTGTWDQHGNPIGGAVGPSMLWIRIQRRSRSGGALLDKLTWESKPIIVFVPATLAGYTLPGGSAGQNVTMRFTPQSSLTVQRPTMYPGNNIRSDGGAGTLPAPTYVSTTINSVTTEIGAGDAVSLPNTFDLTIDFYQASRAGGWGRLPLGTGNYGDGADASIGGTTLKIIRASDRSTLRTKQTAGTSFTYPWSERNSDGNVPVEFQLSEYDASGTPGTAFSFLGSHP